ncbi:MAG TPA: hypothetical protein ENN46_03550 [Candidatus Woesearchaeota archaeon]|nr:hypothetical protein [Candidatus Woesearchaeota archaeon]
MIKAFAILDAISLVFLVLPHFDIILVRPSVGFILFFFSKAVMFRDIASFLDAGVGIYLIFQLLGVRSIVITVICFVYIAQKSFLSLAPSS